MIDVEVYDISFVLRQKGITRKLINFVNSKEPREGLITSHTRMSAWTHSVIVQVSDSEDRYVYSIVASGCPYDGDEIDIYPYEKALINFETYFPKLLKALRINVDDLVIADHTRLKLENLQKVVDLFLRISEGRMKAEKERTATTRTRLPCGCEAESSEPPIVEPRTQVDTR